MVLTAKTWMHKEAWNDQVHQQENLGQVFGICITSEAIDIGGPSKVGQPLNNPETERR